jgi:hypothetical protein
VENQTESIQDKDKYDLVEVIQEIDHEIATKAFAVCRAKQQNEDEAEVRRCLIELRRSIRRNLGLVEDIVDGFGEIFI